MWFKARAECESTPTRRAREGAQRAEAELVEIRGRRDVVDDLAQTIAIAIARNHFGESIEAALALRRGGHQ